MKTFGMGCKIFIYEDAALEKIELLRKHGGDVVLHGHDCLDAELEARRRAKVSKYLIYYQIRSVIGRLTPQYKSIFRSTVVLG